MVTIYRIILITLMDGSKLHIPFIYAQCIIPSVKEI